MALVVATHAQAATWRGRAAIDIASRSYRVTVHGRFVDLDGAWEGQWRTSPGGPLASGAGITWFCDAPGTAEGLVGSGPLQCAFVGTCGKRGSVIGATLYCTDGRIGPFFLKRR